MDKKSTIPKLKWVILKEVPTTTPFFIKNIALGVAGVDTIIFTDLTNNSQFHYVVPGDGISRTAGSRTYSMFVYTERKFTPRIFVVSYPDFTVLKTLTGDNVCKYLHVEFTDTEYLVALTGYPDYMIKIWNFRLGTLMAEELSPIKSEIQKLQVLTQPFLLAQYAQHLGLLVIWEVYATSEHAYLIQRKINIPFLHRLIRIDFCFGIDSLLYVVDNIGNLYNVQNSTGITRKQYTWEGEIGNQNTLVCSYNGGFIITGSNGDLVFVKKIGAFFKRVWKFLPKSTPYWVNSATCDTLYALACNSTLYQIIPNETNDHIEMIQITESDNSIKYFDVINPEGKYMAVVTANDEFRVLETSNKTKISSMYIPNIIMFRAHPSNPCVLFATKEYKIHLLVLSIPEEPKILLSFQLSHNPIMDLQYYRNYMVVYDYKDFFLIQSDIQTELKVIDHIKVEEQILYFTLIRQNPGFDIVALLPSATNNYCSNKLMVIKSSTTGEKKYYDLPDYLFVEVRYIQNKICLTCVNENCFFILNFEKVDEIIGEETDGKPITQKKEVIRLTPSLRLPHQIKLIRVRELDNDFIYSWGVDGTVCIFNTSESYIQAFFVAVQRRTGTLGLINAVRITPNKKYCLVHSEGGVLKCFTYNPDIVEEYSPDSILLNNYFKRPVKNCVEDSNFTWLELIKRNEVEMERQTYEKIKEDIYKEFLIVQAAMKELIDENENLEDEDDILPVPSFNLAKEWTEDIVEKTKKHRDAETTSLMNFINEQNRITKFIIDNTWNKMTTKSAKVYGIMCRTMIENYSLSEKNLNHLKDTIDKIHNWRVVEKDITPINYFFPWLNLYVPQIASNMSLGVSESEFVAPIKENKYALSGTSSHNFIETHVDRTNQLEVVTFSQLWGEWVLSQADVYHLKEYFNKEFSRMKKIKEEEIDMVKQRNARMRVIFTEMNALAKIRGEGATIYPILEDPTFLIEEDPACIVKVEKYEIKSRPYVSSSQQKILDEIAYAEEQRRLLLLADDFHERALIAMMDGTLEKRWEDEIKKDVPKPECMLKKRNPKDLNKDDLKAIKEYEDKVKYNFTERAKYKIMLEREKAKLEHAQSEQILKFNEKCGELVNLKLKIDASVKQEELKVLRFASFNFGRLKFQSKQTGLLLKLKKRKENSLILLSVIEEIEQEVQEIRGKYELLQSRDRVFDKQFKNTIENMAPNFVVDQAFRAFKRRPKWVPKGWATRAVNLEMANRVSTKQSGRNGLPLPEDCYAFLLGLDNLDLVSVAPNVIEPKLWEIVVKMRRQKIETEFRIRASASQLAEAESVLNIITKEQVLRKVNIQNVEKELMELQIKLSDTLINRTVQIVLPLGMIEVDLTGSVDDFKGCALLSGTDISDINTIIKKAGQKKIMAMQKVARFRRKVLFKEWEHKMLQMSVLDMKEFLSIINHSKIYIEIQDFVRDKKKGRVLKVNNSVLNKEIDEKVKYLKRKLYDIDIKIDDVKKKISDQKKTNISLDKEIQNVNIDVTELNMFRDIESEENQIKQNKERLEMCMERARLVRKIQIGHAHLLELSTALELQRLRTYPTLSQIPTVFSCKQ